jgi:hypothetical protein
MLLGLSSDALAKAKASISCQFRVHVESWLCKFVAGSWLFVMIVCWKASGLEGERLVVLEGRGGW